MSYCQSTSLKQDIRQLLAILRNNACGHSRTKQYECLLRSTTISALLKSIAAPEELKVEKVNRHSLSDFLRH
ncbi:MAG TPA: hypothetical protein VEL11_06275 [Candidatus Bathyarchaeia archaeon]|nr:hypothetical protein [Candidatus Bathyarchaeia archaeon]